MSFQTRITNGTTAIIDENGNPVEFSVDTRFHTNEVAVFKLTKDSILPTRNNVLDAGMDLYATEDVFIPIGQSKLIQTQIAINISPGFVGKIEGRSSMNKKGIITSGGVIDSGYSGSIGVILNNFSADTERDPVLYQSGYQVKKGDKIAQLLIYEVQTPKIVEVKELWKSERGDNGFGSSGR